MAVVPEVIIGGLFGEQWKPAATAFQILCLSGPFMAMMRVFGAVSHARGFVFSECGRQVIYLVFVALALWFLFPFGLEGVALAVAIAIVARYLLLAHLALELAGVKWRQLLCGSSSGIASRHRYSSAGLHHICRRKSIYRIRYSDARIGDCRIVRFIVCEFAIVSCRLVWRFIPMAGRSIRSETAGLAPQSGFD